MTTHEKQCPRCRLVGHLAWGAIVAAAVILGAAARSCAQEPPGVRFTLDASDEKPCAVVLSALAEHRSLTVMSPERFDFVLSRLEESALLEEKVAAQNDLIVALRAHVTALEAERAARADLERVLRADLEKAERFVIRTPQRQKLWLTFGFVLGAGAALATQ